MYLKSICAALVTVLLSSDSHATHQSYLEGEGCWQLFCGARELIFGHEEIILVREVGFDEDEVISSSNGSQQLTSQPENMDEWANLKEFIVVHAREIPLPARFEADNLRELCLKGIQLDSLPDSFCLLVNLWDLDLAYNRLKSLPEEFGLLVKIRHLDLSNNQLEIIPESLAKLVELYELDIYHNRISFIPKNIFKRLRRLNYIDLNKNLISSIQEGVSFPSSLTSLRLSNNLLTELPKKVHFKGQLVGLYLEGNQINAQPMVWGELKDYGRLRDSIY
jgi:Leucine-rich repeat (LRR) protein